MKRGSSFLFGLIVGGLIGLTYINYAPQFENNESLKEIKNSLNTTNTDFIKAEQEIEFTTASRFKVFKVLDNGALARCENEKSQDSFYGPSVYILSDGQNLFYNDQIVEVPTGKKAIQIGTQRFDTDLFGNVVPVIQFK